MWIALKALALRWLLGRSVGGLLSLLVMIALPLAGVLKVIGLPILIVLGIIGLPLILILAVIGLPLLLVIGTVSVMMTVVGGLLAAGLAVLKIAIPILIICFIAKWAWGKYRGTGDTSTPKPDTL